jgi:hypothetical protein
MKCVENRTLQSNSTNLHLHKQTVKEKLKEIGDTQQEGARQDQQARKNRGDLPVPPHLSGQGVPKDHSKSK